MFKIVPDTNVLISAVISNGYEFELLKLAKLEKLHLIISYEILWEFEEVIKRPKFGFSPEQILNAIEQIKSISEIIETSIKLDIVKRDPDDNKVIETALEGKADYIISGDKDLLDLKEHNSIKIINAREFLEVFNKTP